MRNQFATALGSNRTQVPTRNEGILPAAACLKIVTSATQRKPASSLAVICGGRNLRSLERLDPGWLVPATPRSREPRYLFFGSEAPVVLTPTLSSVLGHIPRSLLSAQRFEGPSPISQWINQGIDSDGNQTPSQGRNNWPSSTDTTMIPF